jgi:pyruvate dehydrogenase E2 component (dihydrolipoamide acetyltransferase)
MSEIVKIPPLGLDMQEGTFVNWVKQVGDDVQAGEVLAEVEADKATIQIEAPITGILLEKLTEVGDAIFVGMSIAKIGNPNETAVSEPLPPPPPTRLTAHTEPETAAPAASEPVVTIAETPPASAESAPLEIKASPLARKMAFERSIDLRQVQGTGPGGRITKTDIEAFQPSEAAPVTAAAPAAPVKTPVSTAPTPSRPLPRTAAPTGQGITEEPLSRMRQRIAARTTESKQTVPHFYLTIEIDMGPALTLRKHINASLPEEQKVSVNDLVIKAAALTLRQFPNLNSHFYGDKVVRHDYINIGIAVALEGGGLINVVARDADILSISRLAQHNKEMFAAARSGKMRVEDLEGSTFTVSNLGPYDVEHFEAIINPPEAAILAVASARQVPVVIDGEIKVGTRMKCSLSVDHRVSDGAEGALFMKAFRELLENPMRLLV